MAFDFLIEIDPDKYHSKRQPGKKTKEIALYEDRKYRNNIIKFNY